MAAGERQFPKEQRLKDPQAFREVFSGRNRSADSQFLVLARTNRLTYPRLGLAVSRKKVKTAVARNMVKRLVRESFRKNREKIGALDLVVMPQATIDLRDRRKLRDSLESHFIRVSKCRNS